MTTTPHTDNTAPHPHTPPDPAVAAWCRTHLRAAPREVLWEAGHLSRAIGLRLADGRDVVVKVRPDPDDRLAGVTAVQHHLARAAYPCPTPLAAPAPLPGHPHLIATAETHHPGGTIPAPGPASTRLMAHALANLHHRSPAPHAVPRLGPPPPWAHPDPTRPWPTPDDRDIDLNTVPGPPWLDDLAAAARRRLLACTDPLVVGHTDFEAQNLRVDGDTLVAVHDWDSVAALPEAALVGLAAAVHTATGAPDGEASDSAVVAFLDQYTRHRPLTPDQIALSWAAGLWVRLFNAKKDACAPSPTHLEDQLAERAHHARL